MIEQHRLTVRDAIRAVDEARDELRGVVAGMGNSSPKMTDADELDAIREAIDQYGAVSSALRDATGA